MTEGTALAAQLFQWYLSAGTRGISEDWSGVELKAPASGLVKPRAQWGSLCLSSLSARDCDRAPVSRLNERAERINNQSRTTDGQHGFIFLLHWAAFSSFVTLMGSPTYFIILFTLSRSCQVWRECSAVLNEGTQGTWTGPSHGIIMDFYLFIRFYLPNLCKSKDANFSCL